MKIHWNTFLYDLLMCAGVAGAVVIGATLLTTFLPKLEHINPAVASLTVTQAYLVETQYGSGSGVCIEDGYILTAHHVVFGHNMVTVTVGGVVYDVQRYETLDGRDAAILKVDTPALPVPIRQTPIIVGDIVFIVGYPYGNGPFITTGIVSGDYGNGLVLLDAGAQAGNSGGPVFDTNGELIGIVIMVTGGLGRSSSIMMPICDIIKEWHVLGHID